MATRQKLIDNLHKTYPELSKEDIHEIIIESFNYITSELKNGNRVEIRGFGAIELGQKNVISPFSKQNSTRKTVKFKASKNLLEALN